MWERKREEGYSKRRTCDDGTRGLSDVIAGMEP